MDLYRAEARRKHRGRWTRWQGKWKRDQQDAIAQAQRWRTKEPFGQFYVVSTNGMKARLEEIEKAQSSGKPR